MKLLEEGYDNLMQDTIQIDNKMIEWLVQRGFEIPSFNFVTEKESVVLLLKLVI